MFEHGFPSDWSTLKKLIWLKGAGIIGGASAIWKTVTGTLIHITDALASPMQKCEVTLEPIQDLHGQDAPYPAGGGKQLFDIDNPLFSAVVVGYLTLYGSKVEDGKLYNGGQKGITSGSGITIPAEEGNYTLSFYINGESATFEVRAVTLNQDNSWATYTTIYTHMGDDVTGQQTVTVAFPSGYTHLFFSVYSATKYGSWETNVMIEKGSTASPWQPFANICPITGRTGCEVWVKDEYDTSLPATASVTFPDTVYGGSHEFVSGGLKSRYKKFVVDENTSISFSTSINGFFVNGGWNDALYTRNIETDRAALAQAMFCDIFKYDASIVFGQAGFRFTYYLDGWAPLMFVPSVTSKEEAQAWLADNNVTFLYPIANPVEISLTPQEISTLAGENNVWSNGNSVEITYKAQSS